jgi:nitrite reductase (NADH) small subunit
MSENAASAALPLPSASTSASSAEPAWIAVCPIAAIARDTGAVALIAGRQIAIFRVRDDRVFALGNRDPFTGAQVLARGLVGDRGGVLKVASPLLKQSFALATGECLDDPSVRVPAYPARVVDGIIHLEIV